MSHPSPVKLIAIVGGSGAGKGWLVRRLCELLGDKVCHLQLDDFYRDRSHLTPTQRARLNFDVPRAIDWKSAQRVLHECRTGQPTSVPRYDFATHCRISDQRPWIPRPLVLVDGLWLLRPPEVRRLFDLKIYLDTPVDLRRTRRLARDTIERGYTLSAVEHRLRTEVVPMHERYVEPQKKWADIVLTQPFQEAEIVQLADRLWPLLSGTALLQPWMHETFRAELVAQLANHEYCN
jgi:uridine kinase